MEKLIYNVSEDSYLKTNNLFPSFAAIESLPQPSAQPAVTVAESWTGALAGGRERHVVTSGCLW